VKGGDGGTDAPFLIERRDDEIAIEERPGLHRILVC
jgi:hypothetical protein